MRLDESVDQSRHRALVFAVFGQHVARDRQRTVGILFAHDLGGAALVRGVGIRVDQANADRADAGIAKGSRGGAHRLLIERAELLAEEVEAAADFADVAQWHDALRLHPEIGIAVAFRHGLAGNFQDMAETVGDDQAETGDLALQQRIGRDRRAVRQHRQIVDAGAPLTEDGMNAPHQRDRRVRRRRRNLGHAHRAGLVVDTDDVGKSAAGIDADPQVRTAVHAQIFSTIVGWAKARSAVPTRLLTELTQYRSVAKAQSAVPHI